MAARQRKGTRVRDTSLCSGAVTVMVMSTSAITLPFAQAQVGLGTTRRLTNGIREVLVVHIANMYTLVAYMYKLMDTGVGTGLG